jgi:hypothetical protein
MAEQLEVNDHEHPDPAMRGDPMEHEVFGVQRALNDRRRPDFFLPRRTKYLMDAMKIRILSGEQPTPEHIEP